MISNYSQLTIKQFIQCKMISELETDPIMRKVKLLAAIENKEVDEIESLPMKEMFAKLKGLEQVESLQPDGKVSMKFKVGGKRFIVKWRQQDLTAEQYIDASHFCKDPINNIHNILAAISVQRTWYGNELPYNGSNHKEVSDLFYNHMKISTAYPIMLFFCSYSKELIYNIATSLGEVALEELKKLKHSIVSGDGLQPLTA